MAYLVRRKPLVSTQNKAARLRFAKLCLNKPQDVWNSVLWTDKTKLEILGQNAQRHD